MPRNTLHSKALKDVLAVIISCENFKYIHLLSIHFYVCFLSFYIFLCVHRSCLQWLVCPYKTIDILFYCTSSFVRLFVFFKLGEYNLIMPTLFNTCLYECLRAFVYNWMTSMNASTQEIQFKCNQTNINENSQSFSHFNCYICPCSTTQTGFSVNVCEWVNGCLYLRLLNIYKFKYSIDSDNGNFCANIQTHYHNHYLLTGLNDLWVIFLTNCLN